MTRNRKKGRKIVLTPALREAEQVYSRWFDSARLRETMTGLSEEAKYELQKLRSRERTRKCRQKKREERKKQELVYWDNVEDRTRKVTKTADKFKRGNNSMNTSFVKTRVKIEKA